MAIDDAGHPRIEFPWGNVPLQPNDERDSGGQPSGASGASGPTDGTVTTTGGGEGDKGWYPSSQVTSGLLDPELDNHVLATGLLSEGIDAGYAGYPGFLPNDSDNIPNTIVPDLINATQAQAVILLTNAGLILGNVTTTLQGATDGNNGQIHIQSIAAGTTVQSGTAVDIVKHLVQVYTISFDANGGDGYQNSISATSTQPQYTLPEGTYTNGRLTLAGWSLDPSTNYVDAIHSGVSFTATDNTTWYAIWSLVPVKSGNLGAARNDNLDSNDGDGYLSFFDLSTPFMRLHIDAGVSGIYVGDYVSITNSYAGWYDGDYNVVSVDVAAKALYFNLSVGPTNFMPEAGGTFLVANVLPHYPVTFNANGGTLQLGQTAPQTVYTNEEYSYISFPENPYEKEGYNFGGWTADGGATTYQAGARVPVQVGPYNFQAKWGIFSILTGGDFVYTDSTYQYLVFTSSGTLDVTAQDLDVAILVVGGGGSGAVAGDSSGTNSGAGGGGGGDWNIANVALGKDETYTITVGAGGAGAGGYQDSSAQAGNPGNPSSVTLGTGLFAYADGGSGGQNMPINSALNGGASGSRAGGAGSFGGGYNNPRAGGGGAGAGAVGNDAAYDYWLPQPGTGGSGASINVISNGTSLSAVGSNDYFGGGGGGARSLYHAYDGYQPGSAAGGLGGGTASSYATNSWVALPAAPANSAGGTGALWCRYGQQTGNGGSGFVVLRYSKDSAIVGG